MCQIPYKKKSTHSLFKEWVTHHLQSGTAAVVFHYRLSSLGEKTHNQLIKK